MEELLTKLKTELEKISTNAKVNEAQTAAIKELTDYVNLLIDESAAVNKTNKAQDEIDDLLFQKVYELIQKTDELAKDGVKLSKVQNLENKIDKEMQAIKAAGVKDYSEVKDKIADLKEKDRKTDAAVKKVKDDLNDAKTKSIKVDQAQNKEIAENEEDIAALRKDQKEIKKMVDTLYDEYVEGRIRKAEKESPTGIFKTFCIRLFKEIIRFSIYFVVYILISNL